MTILVHIGSIHCDEGMIRMYMTLEEAKSEVWRRWNDKDLKSRVDRFLGGDIPSIFHHEPRCVLVRSIATPNYELFNFAKRSSSLDIEPVVAEYLSDKYSTVNIDKKLLGKISVYRGDNPFTCQQRADVTGYKILDFTQRR